MLGFSAPTCSLMVHVVGTAGVLVRAIGVHGPHKGGKRSLMLIADELALA